MAAQIEDDREILTENASSSPDRVPIGSAGARNREADPSEPENEDAVICGIEDWPAFVTRVQAERRALGAPATRWAGPCLSTALQLAVRGRGWPAERAADALLRVAADPATRSPMRLAEAGPWWDEPASAEDRLDLEAMAQALLEADGVRVQLQVQARRDLEARGMPVTRAAVIRGAYRLLIEPGPGSGAA